MNISRRFRFGRRAGMVSNYKLYFLIYAFAFFSSFLFHRHPFRFWFCRDFGSLDAFPLPGVETAIGKLTKKKTRREIKNQTIYHNK
jgi:hypothetical protein